MNSTHHNLLRVCFLCQESSSILLIIIQYVVLKIEEYVWRKMTKDCIVNNIYGPGIRKQLLSSTKGSNVQ